MTPIDTITTTIDALTARNKDFAAQRFSTGLSLMPVLKTMVVSYVDPRVDPAHVLGLALGEAVVIRNVGGRITPATLQTMAMLRTIAQAGGASPGSGWNLVVLHHTDCGITSLEGHPDMLASYFGIGKEELETKAVADPRAAVKVDVAALKENPFLPGDFIVSGLVYDVATGLLDPIVAPAPLRDPLPQGHQPAP